MEENKEEIKNTEILKALGINEILQERVKLALQDYEELETVIENIPSLIKEEFTLLTDSINLLPSAIDNRIENKIDQIEKFLTLSEEQLKSELNEAKTSVLANFVTDASSMLKTVTDNHISNLDALLKKIELTVTSTTNNHEPNKNKSYKLALITLAVGAILSASITFFAMNEKIQRYSDTALKSYNTAQNIIKLLPADKQEKAKYLLEDSIK